MDKQTELAKLKNDLESRKDMPLIRSANDVVFGNGNPNAEILFIGEAAGYHESIEHKPFVGQAGKLLIKTMKENLGLDREQVYITNIVKTRPPDNRDPTPEEIEAFRPYLDKEIEIISPKIIVTLGRYSMGKFISGVTISKIHGQARFYELPTMNYKLIIFPMYHPAAALRAGSVMAQFVADFGKLKILLGGNSGEVVKIEEKEKEPEQSSLF